MGNEQLSFRLPFISSFTIEASEDVFWHEHQVSTRSSFQYNDFCQECHEAFGPSKYSDSFYECLKCDKRWHGLCVPSSQENINHPCHPNHPLELLLQGPPTYADGKCSLCQRTLSMFVYHCKLCDFSVDMNCVRDPPLHTMNYRKCHEHALTLMGRNVSFTCNGCGTQGERNPYVCLPCSLMFHYDCIYLPHVININRHDHRISFVYPLSPGNRICDICRQDINWRYGSYSCNKCPDFFVHSKCATKKGVWDGVDLEGVPEEEVDIAPFKVIDEGVINHFSHEEHNLFLVEDVLIEGGEGIPCEACCHPISFERYYNCMECNFVLHEECANLPLRKRHGLSVRIFSLSAGKEKFSCGACDRNGNGFRYSDGPYLKLDVRCAYLSWFRHRKIHPHTLFFTTTERDSCVGCDNEHSYVLGCIECKYSLDFKCATLPVVVKHRCDDHYLFLSSGEKAITGKYWCEICEAEVNPEKWFYTCYDCGVVCHVGCVVGDSLNIKPGFFSSIMKTKIEAVLNDGNSRPLCFNCSSRCRFPMVYKLCYDNSEIYVCSLRCIRRENIR